MKLRIRTSPRAELLDQSTVRAPEAAPPASPAGPGSRLVPSQRPATPAESLPQVTAPAPAEPRRRRHLRHRWEITGGDDGRHLISTCQVCGRTRSLATSPAEHRVLDYSAELRRMR